MRKSEIAAGIGLLAIAIGLSPAVSFDGTLATALAAASPATRSKWEALRDDWQALVANDIVHAGNTSSASIPLALSRMIERGELSSGDAVLLLGFGAGISYAGQVIKVP